MRREERFDCGVEFAEPFKILLIRHFPYLVDVYIYVFRHQRCHDLQIGFWFGINDRLNDSRALRFP